MITKYLYTASQLWLQSNAALPHSPFLILLIEGLEVPFRVLDYKERGDLTLLRLKGVETERQAAHLVGAAEVLPDEGLDDEDLIGYTLLGPTGKVYGVIEAIDMTTANVLARLAGGALVPVHEDLIETIDDDAKEIRYSVEPPVI